MRLQPLRMRRITSPIRRGKAANFSNVFEIPDPDLPIHYITFGVTIKIKQEGQHPLTGQRAANFRLLANQ